jgi:hypothetical protein
MFDYLEMHMCNDGTEHCTAYGKFELDSREIWYGTAYSLTNNHKKNTWEIVKHNHNMTMYDIVDHGKDETLDLVEFKQWLVKNKIADAYMDFLKNNKWYCDKYPKAIGVNLIMEG